MTIGTPCNAIAFIFKRCSPKYDSWSKTSYNKEQDYVYVYAPSSQLFDVLVYDLRILHFEGNKELRSSFGSLRNPLISTCVEYTSNNFHTYRKPDLLPYTHLSQPTKLARDEMYAGKKTYPKCLWSDRHATLRQHQQTGRVQSDWGWTGCAIVNADRGILHTSTHRVATHPFGSRWTILGASKVSKICSKQLGQQYGLPFQLN